MTPQLNPQLYHIQQQLMTIIGQQANGLYQSTGFDPYTASLHYHSAQQQQQPLSAGAIPSTQQQQHHRQRWSNELSRQNSAPPPVQQSSSSTGVTSNTFKYPSSTTATTAASTSTLQLNQLAASLAVAAGYTPSPFTHQRRPSNVSMVSRLME